MIAIRKLPILLAVAFSAAVAQDSATVQGSGVVKAGEYLNFDISVDKAPNFDGAGILYWISGPGNFGLQTSCNLPKGERLCHAGVKIPEDTPAGTGYITRLIFSSGLRQFELPIKKVSFQVIARTEPLIFPTSAEVTIRPSQIQLLRGEAARLQDQIHALKATVEGEEEPLTAATMKVLTEALRTELKSLNSTEDKFRKLGDNSQSDAIGVFFSDLRVGYSEVLDSLGRKERKADAAGTLVQASLSVLGDASSHQATRYALTSQAVFRPFEINELAYKLVADKESLTFNLEVNSNPEGATISYGRRGDVEYKQHPNPTNSTLKAPPLAIWTVRFQKQGFKDKTIEFDPFVEPNRVITAALEK
jgi:hypothetical protein